MRHRTGVHKNGDSPRPGNRKLCLEARTFGTIVFN